MDSIFCCVSKLRKDEQNLDMVHVIETEIKKWLELLVKSVDMFASNAAEYFKVLHNQPSAKEQRSTVSVLVSY